MIYEKRASFLGNPVGAEREKEPSASFVGLVAIHNYILLSKSISICNLYFVVRTELRRGEGRKGKEEKEGGGGDVRRRQNGHFVHLFDWVNSTQRINLSFERKTGICGKCSYPLPPSPKSCKSRKARVNKNREKKKCCCE